MDCTAEKKTCEKFGVSGYPTLKVFRHGEFSNEYEGERDEGKKNCTAGVCLLFSSPFQCCCIKLLSSFNILFYFRYSWTVIWDAHFLLLPSQVAQVGAKCEVVWKYFVLNVTAVCDWNTVWFLAVKLFAFFNRTGMKVCWRLKLWMLMYFDSIHFDVSNKLP